MKKGREKKMLKQIKCRELSIWAIVGIIVCDLCKVKVTIEKWQMAFDRFDGIFSYIIKIYKKNVGSS